MNPRLVGRVAPRAPRLPTRASIKGLLGVSRDSAAAGMTQKHNKKTQNLNDNSFSI
jgi:hypothetical protein